MDENIVEEVSDFAWKSVWNGTLAGAIIIYCLTTQIDAPKELLQPQTAPRLNNHRIFATKGKNRLQ